MKITKLQIENFRNYRNFSHNFSADKNITVLTGLNGKGKTNLLEAIYVLSLGKSFRAVLQDDLIQWGTDYFRCRANLEKDDEKSELEVFYSVKPAHEKSFKINDVSVKNTEYIGHLLTVFFHPEDLNILYLSPILRRRYLDILLSQTDQSYLNALLRYRKLLKQRNALLKQIREVLFDEQNTEKLEKDLEIWDSEIARFGTQIVMARLKFINFLSEKLADYYQKISKTKEKITLQYQCNLFCARTQNPPHSTTSHHFDTLFTTELGKISDTDLSGHAADLEKLYLKKLLDRRKAAIFQAKTITGPHRDDLVFFLNDKNILNSASRGEFRTLLLALKMAEIDFIRQKTGYSPLLLLDDVFSELDENRRLSLFSAIDGCQTIITTTDAENIREMAPISDLVILDKNG